MKLAVYCTRCKCCMISLFCCLRMRRSNCELIKNPKAKDTNLLIQTCLGEYYSVYDFNLKTSVWRNKVSQTCVLLTWPQIMDHWGSSLLSVIVFLSSLSQGSQTSCRYWGCKNPCVRFSRFILIILIILIIMIILLPYHIILLSVSTGIQRGCLLWWVRPVWVLQKVENILMEEVPCIVRKTLIN